MARNKKEVLMTYDEWKKEFKKEIIEDIKLAIVLGMFAMTPFLMFVHWLVFGY